MRSSSPHNHNLHDHHLTTSLPTHTRSSEDDDGLPLFPITHEIVLKDHTKVISAVSLDPSGARIVTGSHDYDCKLWDFGGMDWRCKPFKTWEPAGTYYVRCSFLSSRLNFRY